jgi:hypothetical protein
VIPKVGMFVDISSSGVQQFIFILELLDPEHEGIEILQNIGSS